MRILSTVRFSSPRILLSSKCLLGCLGWMMLGVCQGEMLSITTAAGAPGQGPPFNVNGDGTNSSARFSLPAGLSVDAAGAIYLADAHAVRESASPAPTGSLPQ